MNAREHMGQVLEGTGLYDLTGSTPVDWELDAFEAGFAPLEAAFARLLGDLFVATASREQVARWESLFRPQPADAPLEDCRETVLRRFAVHQDSFTPAAVEALLPGAGVRGVLLENEEGGLTIVLGRLLGITKEEATRELDQLLPSHLSWEWDESVTWVAMDAYPRSFAEWDALGLSWTRLESISRADLENDFKEES